MTSPQSVKSMAQPKYIVCRRTFDELPLQETFWHMFCVCRYGLEVCAYGQRVLSFAAYVLSIAQIRCVRLGVRVAPIRSPAQTRLLRQFPERRAIFKAFFAQCEKNMAGALVYYLNKLFPSRPARWLDRVLASIFLGPAAAAHAEVAKRRWGDENRKANECSTLVSRDCCMLLFLSQLVPFFFRPRSTCGLEYHCGK